jgi:DNA adenine methylase
MEDVKSVKPFIKWAGGKKWLTPLLKDLVPKKYNNYFEPFLGSGAIFFHLSPKTNSFLSDLNAELINCYKQIKTNPKLVINQIDKFKNTEREYYKLRNTNSPDKIYNAAKFIFLNKTCYNGIYRVNSKGQFNVPYGHDRAVKIYDSENIFFASNRLSKANFRSADFEYWIDYIEKGDLLFLDPPYTLAHNNNGFIEYNQKLFSWEDQLRLAEFTNRVIQKKAFFILTNAYHSSVIKLYSKLGKHRELQRHSTVTSKSEHRGRVSEFLITNCI